MKTLLLPLVLLSSTAFARDNCRSENVCIETRGCRDSLAFLRTNPNYLVGSVKLSYRFGRNWVCVGRDSTLSRFSSSGESFGTLVFRPSDDPRGADVVRAPGLEFPGDAPAEVVEAYLGVPRRFCEAKEQELIELYGACAPAL